MLIELALDLRSSDMTDDKDNIMVHAVDGPEQVPFDGMVQLPEWLRHVGPETAAQATAALAKVRETVDRGISGLFLLPRSSIAHASVLTEAERSFRVPGLMRAVQYVHMDYINANALTTGSSTEELIICHIMRIGECNFERLVFQGGFENDLSLLEKNSFRSLIEAFMWTDNLSRIHALAGFQCVQDEHFCKRTKSIVKADTVYWSSFSE